MRYWLSFENEYRQWRVYHAPKGCMKTSGAAWRKIESEAKAVCQSRHATGKWGIEPFKLITRGFGYVDSSKLLYCSRYG